MNHDEIRSKAIETISKGLVESDCVEYKETELQRSSILKTLCAYANNIMNRPICLLLIGVGENGNDNDKGTPKRPITGVSENRIESIENSLLSLIPYVSPKIEMDITDGKIDGKSFITIGISDLRKGPYSVNEKAEKDKTISLKTGRYVRIERDTRLATISEEFLLLKKFSNYHFTENANHAGNIDDLNIDQIREYLRLTSIKDNTISLSKTEICKRLDLLDTSIGGSRAKNSAILMFSDFPDKFIPFSYIEVITKTESGENIMKEADIKGPIWKQAKEAMSYLGKNVLDSFTVRDDRKMENRIIYNYPFSTCEELLTNAIVHKDYENQRTIQIYIYPERIVITNYNSPLPPVTIESLNSSTSFPNRTYENPTIREMFKLLGLIESYGSGVGKAKLSMSQNGKEKIHFFDYGEESNITSVEIPINSDYLVLKAKSVSSNEVNNNTQKANNGNQKTNIEIAIQQSFFSPLIKKNFLVIYEYVKDQVFGRSEVIEALHCSPLSGTQYIERLAKANLIVPEKGKGKGKFTFIDC
jgi:predicted HTH transcriptional regulator